MIGNKNSNQTRWWIRVKGKCPQLHNFSCQCKSIGINTMCWGSQLSFVFSMVVHECVIYNAISWFLARDIDLIVSFGWKLWWVQIMFKLPLQTSNQPFAYGGPLFKVWYLGSLVVIPWYEQIIKVGLYVVLDYWLNLPNRRSRTSYWDACVSIEHAYNIQDVI